MFGDFRQRHHEVVEGVGSDVDARNDLRVDPGILELVGREVRSVHREFLDLGQFSIEGLVAKLLLLLLMLLLMLLLLLLLVQAGGMRISCRGLLGSCLLLGCSHQLQGEESS